MAVVSGRLQIRSWTDKDGNKRRTAEVVADNVYFGDSKKDDSGSYGQATGTEQLYESMKNGTYSASTASDFAVLEDDDAQLPF